MNNRASLQLGGDNWAAKDANLLAYKTSLSEKNFLPIEFDFERGFNLAATRVDENGLIEKGRENLLLQSNQFDTTWSGAASTLSGQSGYDGSSDAWLITKSSLYDNTKQVVTNSGVQTFSVYAKAGSYNWMLLHIEDAAGDCLANFDLSTGTLGTLTNGITSKIEDVGSGWYRCSATFNRNVTDVRIYPNESEGYTGTNGSIYIQDAQLEQGLVATDYIETGATTAQAGVLEDLPRINYSGSTPSLLLEPSRTNEIGYSEYFEGTGWTAQAGITLTPNTTETLSPEGLYNAYKVVSTDATKGFYFSGLNITNAAVRTIYLKGSVGGETVVLKDPSGFGTPSTKTLTTDWQRFELATTNDGNTYQGLFIDDISVGTIYAYGAQLEEGSYPTSYIPTYGTAATRGGDSSTSNTISNINEGVLFFEGSVDKNENTIKLIEFNDGTLNNRIFLYYRDTTGTLPRLYAFATNGGTQVYGYVYNIPSGRGEITHKVAFRFADNDFALFYNGTKVHSQTSGTISTNPKNQVMYETSAGAIPFRGNVKQTLVFPEALSDADCITLTTL